LLSSLGQNEPTYEVSEVEPLRPDDAFLICSDGLWAHLSTKTIATESRDAASLQDWLDRLAQHVERADDPSQDNFTAIAFRVSARAG
jgi:serine/threonine protein phosphatase PrpC